MSQEFLKHIEHSGEEGRKWLADIPKIISKAEEKWSVKVAEPFSLTYNYVAPATRADGSGVVLKIGFPKDQEFQTEIAALKLYHGEGIEKLLEEDPETTSVLLERVFPGKPISAVTDDAEATEILAGVMKKLWKKVPETHPFPTITKRAEALMQIREQQHGTTGPLPEKIVDHAQELFQHLVHTQAEPVLTHGDLHQENVLSSDRDGWLAIDPKGVVAEPCFDTAVMIRNPYDKLKDIPNLEPLLRTRIEILSQELGFPKERIRDWGIVQSVLSAVWNMHGPKGWEHAIRVAETLAKLS